MLCREVVDKRFHVSVTDKATITVKITNRVCSYIVIHFEICGGVLLTVLNVLAIQRVSDRQGQLYRHDVVLSYPKANKKRLLGAAKSCMNILYEHDLPPTEEFFSRKICCQDCNAPGNKTCKLFEHC